MCASKQDQHKMSDTKMQVAYYGPIYIKNNCLILPVKTESLDRKTDGDENAFERTELTISTDNSTKPEVAIDESDLAIKPSVNEKSTQVSSDADVLTEVKPERGELEEISSRGLKEDGKLTPKSPRHWRFLHHHHQHHHNHNRTKSNGEPEPQKTLFKTFKSYIGLGKSKSDPVVNESGTGKEEDEDLNNSKMEKKENSEHEEVARVLERLDTAIDKGNVSTETHGTNEDAANNDVHTSSTQPEPYVSISTKANGNASENCEEKPRHFEDRGARPKVKSLTGSSPESMPTSSSDFPPERKSSKQHRNSPRSWLQKNVHNPSNSVPYRVSDKKSATESKASTQHVHQKRRSLVKHRRHSSSDGRELPSHTRQQDTFSALGGLLGRRSHYLAVVAIDFGTTFSGYAYSFTDDPTTIHMMRRLEGGDPGVFNQKTPTTILLTPDGQFHSFGYGARDFFHDLDPKEARKWMYIERFKMLLHGNACFNKDSTLTSNNGKEISSLKVFSYGLAYFKDHALKELSDQSGLKVTCDDIRWVITVPAIWNASAKQFMRQAAYDAGIVTPDSPDQLLIALEPEAASIYCRKLRMYEMVVGDSDNENADDTPMLMATSMMARSPSNTELRSRESFVASDIAIGTRYMVVDCGGGTVDITVHQLEEGGKLKELYRATGGPHGSVGVDEEFERLLRSVFGSDCIDQFQQKRPSGWVDIMISFEAKKRTAGPTRTSPITVSFPFSFIDFYKKNRGGGIETAVKKYGDKDITWTPHGMFRMAPAAMRLLFIPTVDRIKQAIGDVLNSTEVTGLSYMFLVGGFAESSILQHEIRKDFGHLLKVIIPHGVGMTIVKGAVLFGLDPLVVNERRSQLTYGVGVLHRFNSSRHPADKKVTKDGIDWCTDILDRFVIVDQSVAVGDVVVRSYTPVRRDQTSTVINVYGTERPDVTYITDDGVTKCGALCLELVETETEASTERSKLRREIKTSMKFGDTEIKVTAVDVKTGNTVYASIDFLNT